MKEFLLLRFLDRFESLFQSSGVDYPVMRKILQLKLVMDERRVPTIMTRGRKSEGKGTYRSSLFIYAFIGLFIGMLILPPFPVYFKMNLVLGMILFMIMTTMISDFSSVLLDIKDKNILLTRPVQARALNAAKLIHIVYYLISITAAIAGVSLIAGLIRYGLWFFILLLLELILMCVFVILITSIIYYAILHFFSGEKLKDIINYFQIILSIAMVVMYQLVGRVYNFASLNIHAVPQWWNFILPSAWFAAPFAIIAEHRTSTIYIALTLAAIAVPVSAMVLYLKVAAPAFERNLQKLSSSGGFKRELKKGGVADMLADTFCRSRTEKSFFRFSRMMMANERKLKLKLYPSLAFSAIMPFIFLFSLFGSVHSIAELTGAMIHGHYYITLYFSAAFLCPSILMLSMSENYKGAWIYRAMPIKSPAEVIRGAIKAFLYKFVVPVYLFTGLIFIILCGPGIIPDIILIFLNMLILLLIMFTFSKKELPFYKNFDIVQTGNNTAVAFISLGLCGIFAAVHYALLTFFAPGVYLFMGLSLAAVLILWHISFRITWDDIAKDA